MGVVAVDLLHRYPGFVDKLVFFDTVPPLVFDDYVAAGLDPMSILSDGPTGDYRERQGATPPDELAADLDTVDKRRRYIGGRCTATGCGPRRGGRSARTTSTS